MLRVLSLLLFITKVSAFISGFPISQVQYFEPAVPRTSSAIIPRGRLFHIPSFAEARERLSSDAGLDLLQVASASDVSLGAGVAGLFIILFNRVFLADFANEISTDSLAMAASDIQSRSDILSVMACSALLLNVLSDQDFTTRERDKVELVGYSFKSPYLAPKAGAISDQLTWLLTSVTKIEPVTSVHVFDGDFNLLGASGVVHSSFSRNIPSSILEKSPILTQALDENQEVYLPDLQVCYRVISIQHNNYRQFCLCFIDRFCRGRLSSRIFRSMHSLCLLFHLATRVVPPWWPQIKPKLLNFWN